MLSWLQLVKRMQQIMAIRSPNNKTSLTVLVASDL